MTGLVLAHQGGWDEMLVVAVPIGAFALLLWLANKKAGRLQEEREGAAEERAERGSSGPG